MDPFFSHPPQALDAGLEQLALAAGIQMRWEDILGRIHTPDADVLRNVFGRLGLPCATSEQAADTARALRERAERATNPWFTATVARPLVVPASAFDAGQHYLIDMEGAGQLSGTLQHDHAGRIVTELMPSTPGYHQLHIGDRCYTLAVAPERCWTVQDAQHLVGLDRRQLRATAAQLYGLRAERGTQGGLGTYTALATLAQQATRAGLHGVLLSPLHAMFASQPTQFSPYSPSSRLAFNDLYVDLEAGFGAELFAATITPELHAELTALSQLDQLDWPRAAVAKRALAQALFERASTLRDSALWQAFLRFEAAPPLSLLHHAWYEAIQHTLLIQTGDPAMHHWKNWPEHLRDLEHPGVQTFVAEQARLVQWHLFMQWLALTQYTAARNAAKAMPLGLMVDLAVGSDPAGSHAWSRQHDMLHGLSLGAPPDDYNMQGQSWGLTTLSPIKLQERGFGAYVELLRANMHASAIRIDHAAGLGRLWLVPDGSPAGAGVYLRMPLPDLARLVALESARQQCVVIGEDLGTVEDELRHALADVGVPGLQPLLFQRRDNQFVPPSQWRRNAVAVSSTHDMAPLAGWWHGRDLHARLEAGLISDLAAAEQEREQERQQMAQMLRLAGTGFGAGPEGTQIPEDGAALVDAALTAVAATPSPLALAPLEDLLALEEEQNLPGTINEYPNWRIRLPVPVERVFDEASVQQRILGWLNKA
ncbi:4-alpha-glucanotransferase [Amantichitinum ursilacus]|uniref:4-alpha-glucanotransferase n=2 Tax=Amantichitinum ursilacus TaxID=857265 RepID=A0A0N1JT70_9NEIS|nr:4-alpha-glucanotransferase [Amantichitinum ursilacus]